MSQTHHNRKYNPKRPSYVDPRPRKCKCGCGQMTVKGMFVKGHHNVFVTKLADRAEKSLGDLDLYDKLAIALMARKKKRGL